MANNKFQVGDIVKVKATGERFKITKGLDSDHQYGGQLLDFTYFYDENELDPLTNPPNKN